MPGFESWRAFYTSELQSLWLLEVAPALFLLWRALGRRPPGPGAAPRVARFVAAWCVLFAFETLLDPLATGPLLRALGWQGVGASAIALLFVLLGDFRIWWLVFHLARPGSGAALRALVPTLLVPAFAWSAHALLVAVRPGVPDQGLWLLHEVTFLCVALALRAVWLPRHVAPAGARRFAAAVLLWAAGYYALWALADVWILAGVDAGWGLRVVPNQLYYGLTVPFVWWRFFSAPYAATSTSTQAAR